MRAGDADEVVCSCGVAGLDEFTAHLLEIQRFTGKREHESEATQARILRRTVRMTLDHLKNSKLHAP